MSSAGSTLPHASNAFVTISDPSRTERFKENQGFIDYSLTERDPAHTGDVVGLENLPNGSGIHVAAQVQLHDELAAVLAQLGTLPGHFHYTCVFEEPRDLGTDQRRVVR